MELACLRISCITKQEALCLGWHMDSHQWVSMPRINLFQQVDAQERGVCCTSVGTSYKNPLSEMVLHTFAPSSCSVSRCIDECSFWNSRAQQQHVTIQSVPIPLIGGPRLDTSYRPVRMPLGKLVQSRPPYSGVLPSGMGSMMGIDPSYKPAVYRQQPPVSQGQILRQQLQAKLVRQSCALGRPRSTASPSCLLRVSTLAKLSNPVSLFAL